MMATSEILSAGSIQDHGITVDAGAQVRGDGSRQQVDIPAEEILDLAAQASHLADARAVACTCFDKKVNVRIRAEVGPSC